MTTQTFEQRPLPASDRWPFVPVPAARDGKLRDNLVSDDELHDMLTHGGREALAVIDRARDVTRELYANRRTYVVNRNVNFTDVCEYHCTFCGYKTAVGDPGGKTFSVDEILASLAEPYAAGISEVCITGGLNPALGLDYYLDLVGSIRARYSDLHIHAFSPDEYDWLSQKTGKSIGWLVRALHERGVDSSPGTAAEILDDEVRAKICPEKVSTARWVEVIRECHAAGVPTTATMLAGHIEEPRHIVNHLRVIRDLALETGGFTEFVILPFVPYETPLKKKVGGMLSNQLALLLHAAARLYLHDVIDHIQVSWVKLGPLMAREMIATSCDDIGGTLYDENITRKAGGKHGTCLSEGDLRGLIDAAGCVPERRTTVYNRIVVPARVAA